MVSQVDDNPPSFVDSLGPSIASELVFPLTSPSPPTLVLMKQYIFTDIQTLLIDTFATMRIDIMISFSSSGRLPSGRLPSTCSVSVSSSLVDIFGDTGFAIPTVI